jgi:hypothetical protein
MEVVGEVYIHEIEVLHDSCRECSKILPRACGSMHVSDHVTATYIRVEPSVSCHRGLTLRKLSAGHNLPAEHSGDKNDDGGGELHINY